MRALFTIAGLGFFLVLVAFGVSQLVDGYVWLLPSAGICSLAFGCLLTKDRSATDKRIMIAAMLGIVAIVGFAVHQHQWETWEIIAASALSVFVLLIMSGPFGLSVLAGD